MAWPPPKKTLRSESYNLPTDPLLFVQRQEKWTLRKRQERREENKIFANGLGTSRIPVALASGCVLGERNLTRDEEIKRGEVGDKGKI